MKKKMDSLQALRCLCCICVYFYHCYSKVLGLWAVTAFIMLSGFLLTFRHVNDTPREGERGFFYCLKFAWGKTKKLYVLYLLSMLPMLALELYSQFSGLYELDLVFTAKKLAAVALMIQAWIPSNQYVYAFNGVGWYVSASFFTYFAFPYIIRIIRGYKSRKSPYYAIIIVFALMLVLGFAAPALGRLESRLNIPNDDSFEMWFTHNFPLYKVLEFIIGCNLGCIFANLRSEPAKKNIVGIDIICIVLFLPALYIYKCTDSILAGDAFKYSQLFTPFCVMFISALAIGKGIIARVLTNPVTVFLGNISGWFFLIHSPVIKYYHVFMSTIGASEKLISILIVPITAAVSVLLSMLYDRIIKSKPRQL